MKITRFFAFLSLSALVFSISCSNEKKASDTQKSTDDETFYATQPVKSGLYDADFFNITGDNPREGHFDGRIYFALSPDINAFYVFENGNRTKIDYTVVLSKPFEKTDSGTFVSVDTKNHPVTIIPDSVYVLKFDRGESNIAINFSPKPRHTASALEIMEKINESHQKNK